MHLDGGELALEVNLLGHASHLAETLQLLHQVGLQVSAEIREINLCL